MNADAYKRFHLRPAASVALTELSSDELRTVAGGGTTRIVCDDHIVTPKPPPNQIPLP
jgi:hypothetical protein